MVKVCYFFISLIILNVSAQAKITVYGRVTDTRGKPIPVAYVFLTHPSENNPVKQIEVQKNGKYEIAVDSKGLWMLHFTGLFHHEYEIPIYYRRSKKLRLDVKLSTYHYGYKYNHPKVFGNFNGWQKYRAVSLKKNKDGKYSAEVNCKSDTVIYRLIYVRTGGEVAGTDADGYIPNGIDSGGIKGYNSYIVSKKRQVNIVFDPSKLVRTAGRQSFRFYPAGSFEAKFARAYAALEDTKRLYLSGLYSHFAKFDLSYKFDFGYPLGKLKNRINKEKNGIIRQVLMLNYFELSYLSTHGNYVQISTARLVLKGIPFNSVIWSLSPHSIFRALSKAMFPEALKDKYIHMLLNKNPVARTKEELLHDVIDWKFHTLNYRGILPYLSILMDQYGDSPEALSYGKEYSRYIKLKAGDKTPDFSFKSLTDSSRVFTNKTFLGKYCLLYFWSDSNKTSVDEIYSLEKTADQYAGKNCKVLAVSLDKSKNNAEDILMKYPDTSVLNAIDKNGLAGDLCRRFEIYSVPAAVLINPDGIISALGWELHGANLTKTMDKILEN